MSEFYLKAKPHFDKERPARVLLYFRYKREVDGVKVGHDGPADDHTIKARKDEYADYLARLEAYGEDKAHAECRAKGFFVPPSKPKPKKAAEETQE